VPLAVCEARDPKGLYKLARAGMIKGILVSFFNKKIGIACLTIKGILLAWLLLNYINFSSLAL
jgi:hypothetical protein